MKWWRRKPTGLAPAARATQDAAAKQLQDAQDQGDEVGDVVRRAIEVVGEADELVRDIRRSLRRHLT